MSAMPTFGRIHAIYFNGVRLKPDTIVLVTPEAAYSGLIVGAGAECPFGRLEPFVSSSPYELTLLNCKCAMPPDVLDQVVSELADRRWMAYVAGLFARRPAFRFADLLDPGRN